jgi:hypothetical protein
MRYDVTTMRLPFCDNQSHFLCVLSFFMQSKCQSCYCYRRGSIPAKGKRTSALDPVQAAKSTMHFWPGLKRPIREVNHLSSFGGEVRGPGKLSPYSDSLGAGQSGDRTPVGGGEIFRTRPGRPWSPPSLLHHGYGLFPGGKAAGSWRWPSTPI